jgi:DNA-binding response OmpR family regulator
VESEGARAQEITESLRAADWNVVASGSGEEALRLHEDVDLVLLDLEIRDMNGLDLCREIRSRSDVPMIVATSKTGEVDRVLGLQAGADDCLAKPYGFRELQARIEAILRRSTRLPPPTNQIRHADLCINVATRQVHVDGNPVRVTRKEFDLLHILAANPEIVLSRQRLLHEVWGGSFSRRTIDTHVGALRSKLGAASWIVTVRGVGYRIGRGH